MSEESEDNNVIEGPWPDSIVNLEEEGKSPETQRLKTEWLMRHAEEFTQNLIVQMIHSMSEHGIDISEKSFVRDTAIIIEFVNGVIYRDMGLPHHTHGFVETFVEVYINDENNIETDINVDFMKECIDAIKEEMDDDPEPA